ncbi:MAG: tetratricopeptide repeat protein [Acuticoccus sp.]
MSEPGGPAYGLVGAIAAYPRRQLARAVEAAGGRLGRGVTRQTTHAVFGRSVLSRLDEDALAARIADAARGGCILLSECAFLGRLGLVRRTEVPAATGLSRAEMIAKSGLSPADLDGLALFDAFEQAHEPFAFRDLIVARKYAGLIGSGASWPAIARAVHSCGREVSLTAAALQVGAAGQLVAREGGRVSELSGQLVLGLGAHEEEPDELFLAAQAAEEEGDHGEAAALYARCLVHDPTDATAAFNRGNTLREAGRTQDAAVDYLRALRHDPTFVEAWFNLAALAREEGRTAAAERYLDEAIARDRDYGDAVFNRAALAFDTGDHAGARRWWARYLELDNQSEWARQAERGLAYLARAGAGRFRA